MSEWRPAKTAPKDGDEFLALNGKNCTSVYWVVYWNGKMFECVASGSFPKFHSWMPLPKPPHKPDMGTT